MKTIKDIRAKTNQKSHVEMHGDPYDMGLSVTLYIKGKQVSDQTLHGEDDFSFEGKKYADVSSFLAAAGKKYKVDPKSIEVKWK